MVEAPTARVVTENVAEDENAVTVAGTVAALEFELERVTILPAAGADPLKETVPVEGVPPATLAGATETAVRTAGVTVSVADRDPLK